MQIEIFPDPQTAGRSAASRLAAEARAAVKARGKFLLAASGGKVPWQMFADLTHEDIPWEHFHIFQVDERVAPDGHPDRNLTHLRECLLGRSPMRAEQIHPMPVNDPDLRSAAAAYARTLGTFAGNPPVFDVVHLGMGPDGHTASLVPGNSVLNVTDVDVAPSGPYQDRMRLTLTYPAINRARLILWLITDASKADVLVRMRSGDPTIPAGRISQEHAVVFCDQAAAARLGTSTKS